MKSQKGKENKGNLIGSNNVDPTTQFDGSLSCDNDNDFSCAQWNADRDLAILVNHLSSYKYTITVTQSMLDKNKDIAFVFSSLLSITPAYKFGQLLNVFAMKKISDLVMAHISAGAGAVLQIGLNELITTILNGDSQAGDVITIENGKVTKITRTGTATNGGSSGSTGDTGVFINNGMTLGDMYVNISNLKLVCKIVYTKTGNGAYHSQEVCYIN